MKKIPNWQITLALILIALSVVFYLLHFLIFRDVHHIFIYLIGDIAFLFIDVMIVTLVLNRLLVYREKQAIIKKINIVIDAFYSEVGTDLMKICLKFTSGTEAFKEKLVIKAVVKLKVEYEEQLKEEQRLNALVLENLAKVKVDE